MAQKILIIEDDKLLGEVLTRKLSNEGYLVSLVADGAEGLEQFKKIRPDLLLLDIILPNLNGYEILESRAKDPDLMKIPVIIISNSGQPVEINRALALGIKDYLIKAVLDPDTVLSKVKFALEHPELTATHTVSLKGKKILWIEDDMFLSDILARTFSKEECVSLYASNGEDALKKLDTETPDLILMDLILPGMSGFEILEKIRANPRLKTVPIIIFSNLGQESDIERAKRLGANKHLLKADLNPGDVVQEIAQLLNAGSGV